MSVERISLECTSNGRKPHWSHYYFLVEANDWSSARCIAGLHQRGTNGHYWGELWQDSDTFTDFANMTAEDAQRAILELAMEHGVAIKELDLNLMSLQPMREYSRFYLG